ncbi:hypothetical protein BH18ACI4_BH18ACI4_02000 [soil metagenome]
MENSRRHTVIHLLQEIDITVAACPTRWESVWKSQVAENAGHFARRADLTPNGIKDPIEIQVYDHSVRPPGNLKNLLAIR